MSVMPANLNPCVFLSGLEVEARPARRWWVRFLLAPSSRFERLRFRHRRGLLCLVRFRRLSQLLVRTPTDQCIAGRSPEIAAPSGLFKLKPHHSSIFVRALPDAP
jgi:hypothetical protein